MLEISKRYANKREPFENFDNETEAITALSSRSIPLCILGVPVSSQERSDQEGRTSDYWCIENGGKELVRYHSTPRATRFSPEAVKGIPVEISNLEQKRKTIGECIYGLNLYEDEDLWQGDINPAEEPFPLPWYGQTRFDLKEAVPVSAQAEAEAAKAKPKAKSRPVLDPVPEEASHAGKGKGTWKSAKKKGGDPEAGSGDRRRNSSQVEIQQLLKGVAALCLGHEDSLSILHLDKGFVLFQQTKSPESLLQTMFSISTQWKKSKETGQVTSPLRVVLLKCFITELQARLEKAEQDEPTKAAVIKAGWATQKDAEGLCWPYFQYDPQTKTETVDINKTPTPRARAIDVLKGILVLLSPETLRKFHATRPLAEQYESEMISFLIHVALRGDLSEQLYRQLLQLEHNSVMFLMGARLRRERIQRSPLANHVAGLM